METIRDKEILEKRLEDIEQQASASVWKSKLDAIRPEQVQEQSEEVPEDLSVSGSSSVTDT